MNEELIHKLLEIKPCANCETVVELVMELVDSQLDTDLHEMLMTHIEQCGYCQRIQKVEVHMRSVISRSMCCQAPDELRKRIPVILETWSFDPES